MDSTTYFPLSNYDLYFTKFSSGTWSLGKMVSPSISDQDIWWKHNFTWSAGIPCFNFLPLTSVVNSVFYIRQCVAFPPFFVEKNIAKIPPPKVFFYTMRRDKRWHNSDLTIPPHNLLQIGGGPKIWIFSCFFFFGNLERRTGIDNISR